MAPSASGASVDPPRQSRRAARRGRRARVGSSTWVTYGCAPRPTRIERRLPVDAPSPDVAELVEADVRAGRREQAQARLASFARAAEASGAGWARARVAYLRALLAPADEVDGAFDVALVEAVRSREPLALSRAQLGYGERLRRIGRRVDARVHLRAALLELEHRSETALADRARRELLATTQELLRAPAYHGLTDRELQVARVVARGASNKGAAAELFLSPKTIEKHLHAAFAKLGVRSRGELALLFARDDFLPDGERARRQVTQEADRR